ncbi:MAG: NAD(+)/NADH kinase [Planctomycetota bacterium]
MRKIYVIANPKRKPDVVPLLEELLPWMRKCADVVKVDKGGESDLSHIQADLVLVFGGDGSILSAARRLHGNPVPVFGVNVGHLGFMAEISAEELQKTLPQILRGEYVLSRRMMLLVCVVAPSRRRHNGHPEPHEYVALNDAVIQRFPRARMISVDVRVSGEEVSVYKGDGLIVSTATGSTAYNLSAGGPILSERLKALIVTPISPHTLASRPIVLSGEETVEVRVATRTGEPVELVVDGQVSCPLPSGAVVEIGRAPYEFNLVTVGRKGRYEIIRDKLHWAGWVKER